MRLFLGRRSLSAPRLRFAAAPQPLSSSSPPNTMLHTARPNLGRRKSQPRTPQQRQRGVPARCCCLLAASLARCWPALVKSARSTAQHSTAPLSRARARPSSGCFDLATPPLSLASKALSAAVYNGRGLGGRRLSPPPPPFLPLCVCLAPALHFSVQSSRLYFCTHNQHQRFHRR